MTFTSYRVIIIIITTIIIIIILIIIIIIIIIIDFAVPGDSRIEEKVWDKIEKYQGLGRKLQKAWNI